MKVYLRVVNPISPVRQKPSKASLIKFSLDPDEDMQYMASKLYMGWYYIEDGYDGWIEAIDVQVVRVEQNYDPTEDYGYDTEQVEPVNTNNMNGDEVIKAINTSKKYIMANKILYKDENDEVPIYTLLSKVLSQFKTMEDIVNNLDKYPDIPSLPKGNIKDFILIVNSDNKLEWRKMNVSNLLGTAELDIRFKNEF